MKKAVVILGMVFALGLVANVALSDETVIFPFWQKGAGMSTFYSIANAGTLPITGTVEQMTNAGVLHSSTTATVQPGQAWGPDCWETWCTSHGDGMGFGRYLISSTENRTYLWSCLYSYCAGLGGPGVDAQPGFTMNVEGAPFGTP